MTPIGDCPPGARKDPSAPYNQPTLKYEFSDFSFNDKEMIVEYYINSEWKQMSILADYFYDRIYEVHKGEYNVVHVMKHPDYDWVFVFVIYLLNEKYFPKPFCVDIENLIK